MKIKKNLSEGKVPETVMTGLDIRFSGNRGKFKSASEKFIAVRDMMASKTQDKEMQNYIKTVTPASFFRYRKGHRDMIQPENTPVTKSTYQPITDKDKAKKIPFEVDTTGEFKPLPNEVFKQHLYPAVIQYYKNTYHNSMPSRELATKIVQSHYIGNDDIYVNSVLDSLNKAHVDSSVKSRIDDDTIVSKSVEHFGFNDADEMGAALSNEYSYVHDRIFAARKRYGQISPTTIHHNQFHQAQRDAGIYRPMLDKAKTEMVRAYLKRDAKALDTYTKEYQLIKYYFKL